MTVRKRNKQHFKTVLFVFVSLLSVLHGLDFGDLLLPDLIDIGTEILSISFSEKIYSTLVAVLGTIILLISVCVLLKRVFRIIDGKSDKRIKKALLHRICTTLSAFFEKFTVKFVYRKAIRIVKKYVIDLKAKAIFDKQMKMPRQLLVLRFSRILI